MSQLPANAKSIFLVALERYAPDQWATYLDEACGSDKELRCRVEGLLEAHDKLGTLPSRVSSAVDPTLDGPLCERPGTQIGPYKLVEQIGEGGMGVVYMAAQKEPVRRKVALKIIKPGMDTREVIARFAAEEQALALMDHPNIAKVLDAGATESSRPYFVMELVSGVPLTQYCDDNSATMVERLQLFVQVCHAVQHAHHKGIIHRDIKPSNILVTMHDGVPVPKIIDFGIAKAINQQLTADTVYTSHGQMIGTPLYMSPEQAEHSGLDIDTRSDIYSLGVLLYELLTGSTPFDRDDLKDAGYDEVRRLIREQEPPRPSTRISTLGKAATTVSEHRRTNPVELSNSLRHELDWIVMKALEKDRTRRYQTTNDFARDIERYLHDEPVEACPPSTVYRLKKFTRRHRTGVLATGAVGLALILGTGVAAGQAYRATKAERLAEEQLQKANEQQRLAKEQAALARKQKRLAEQAATSEAKLRAEAERQRDLAQKATQEAEASREQAAAVAKFLGKVFQMGEPGKPAVTVLDVLNRAQDELAAGFQGDVLVKARILQVLGGAYLERGRAQQAVPLIEQAREIFRNVLGDEHAHTIECLHTLLAGYIGAQRNEEAVELGQQLLQRERGAWGPDKLDAINVAGNLMCAQMDLGRHDEAIRSGEKCLQAMANAGPADDPSWQVVKVNIMNNLATAYGNVGRDEDAIRTLADSLKSARDVLGPENRTTITVMHGLSASYYKIGRLADARKLEAEACDLEVKVYGPEHPQTLFCMGNMAMKCLALGEMGEANRLAGDALRVSRAVLPAEHEVTRFLILDCASVALASGDYDAATKLFEEYLPPLEEIASAASADTAVLSAAGQLAEAYSKAARHEEALPWAEQARRLAMQSFGAEHLSTLTSLSHLARVHCAAGRYSEAVPLLEEAIPAMTRCLGPEHYRTVAFKRYLAVALRGAGRLEEAIALHAETLALGRKALGPEHPQTLASMLLLGSAYIEQARYADAEPLLLAAHEGYAKRDAAYPTPYDHAQAREACAQLVQLYEKSNQPEKATAWKEKQP